MKKRYTEEQIIKALKEYESGVKVDDLCRRLGISDGTFYNWRNNLESFKKRLVLLEKNQLKKILF
jgi:putative transposase